MESRLEWYECPRCDMKYTWFRVEVMEGLELYGWLHKTDGDCPRDKGLELSDTRVDGSTDTV